MIVVCLCILMIFIIILFFTIGQMEKRLKLLETTFIMLHKVEAHQDILNDIIDKNAKRTLN